MISMNRPSRAARASATTTRYAGCFVRPVRRSRMCTATAFPSRVGLAGRERQGSLEPPEPPFHVLEALHHLLELRVLLAQAVHVPHPGAAPPRDARAAAAVDERRVAPLGRSHRRDDRPEPVQVLLLAVELLRHPPRPLEEGQHVEDL